MESSHFKLIVDDSELLLLSEELMNQDIIAVDLEADSLHHYREKVCLLQFSTLDNSWIVDPLAVKDMSPLKPVFASSSIIKVFHGADYDVRSLYRDFEIEIGNLFDTMIAAQFLEEKELGLAALLSKRFGVSLDKKFQTADWSKRPLSSEMLEYASMDTRLLIPLYQQMIKELVVPWRYKAVIEKSHKLSSVRSQQRDGDPIVLRFKGASRLKGRHLATLSALLEWRDSEAKRRDVPPFKVIGNEILTQIAENLPTDESGLNQLPSLSKKLQERYGEPILQVVTTGMNSSYHELEALFVRKNHIKSAGNGNELLKRLKAWRTKKSAELGVDSGIILSNSEIERICDLFILDRNSDLMLNGWQMELFGNEIIEILS